MSISLIQGGSFVSNGAGQYITLSGGADYFIATNLTQAAAATSGVGYQFRWYADRTPIGGGLQEKFQSTGAITTSNLASGGFVYSPGANLPQYPVQTGTTITNAGPAVCSATNTLQNGDRVRLSGLVGMLQVSGLVATVSSVSGSAFTLAGLDASAFAAAASAFKFQKIGPFEAVLPEYAMITNISNAVNGVITISSITNYVAGMKIRLSGVSAYGMAALEGVEATILSVGDFSGFGDYTLTIDVDTSAAGSWVWPSSALSVNSPRFATIAPAGQRAYYDLNSNIQYGYNVSQAPFQSAYPSPTMYLAPGANGPGGQVIMSVGDIIEWQAFRYE